MAKVLIFIDHDIMIRHFIQSAVFRGLEKLHDVVYVLPQQHRRVKANLDALNMGRYRLLEVSDARAHLLRRLYQATVLRRGRHSPDKSFLFDFWRKALGRPAFLASWFYSWPITHWAYKTHILNKIGPNQPLELLLTEERPDVILHPTVLEGLFIADLIQWAKREKPPVVFLMNSWDNPSTKAMTIGWPDWLVVWGEQSKMDAVRHMQFPSEKILCFGAAQFDVYREPCKVSPEKFLLEMGLSPKRKTLLYAGSSKGLNEVSHLRILEKAISDGQIPLTQIIFRPHPWRGIVSGEPDFYSIKWQHVKMDPQMADYYKASRSELARIFLPDYEHTHNLLNAVDAVVSPISTILLEAAMHGKPVLAYMPEEEIQDNFFVQTMANMKFIRDFCQRIGCGPCKSSRELVAACNSLMEATNLPGISDRLRQESSYFVANGPRPYGQQLVELVDRLTRSVATAEVITQEKP